MANLLYPSFRPERTGKLLLLAAWLIFNGSFTAQASSDIHQSTPLTPSALEEARSQKFAKKSAFPKLHPALSDLVVQRKSSQASLNPSIRVDEQQRVQTYLDIFAINSSVIAELERLGLQIEISNANLNKIQAWVPIAQLTTVSASSNIRFVDLPRYARTNKGRTTTQGDRILRADRLRAKGITGKGIRVGIISDGANDWRSAAASGDLPSSITTYGSCTKRSENLASCSPEWRCNEGTAMAEIIHDLAPDADIAVAAVNTSLEFVQQVNRLANTFKADVIVDDLGFFGEPYFEDGDLARAVSALPENVLYFSSAGNAAHVHYEDNYRRASGFSLHSFSGSNDPTNGFIVPAQGYTFALLQWSDRYESANSDYDLYITDASGNLTQQSATGGSTAIEGVCIPNTSGVDIVRFANVDKFSGSDRRLEMFFLGAGVIEHNITSDSIFGHAATPRALAIAAINASDPGNDSVTFYSSRGPATIFYPSFVRRAKPDLAAIDGVDVTGTGGFPSPFFGTSAAAPHAAGVAALLLSASNQVTPSAVRTALLTTAVGGRNSSLGFGRIDAEAALEALALGGNPIPAIMLLLDEDE